MYCKFCGNEQFTPTSITDHIMQSGKYNLSLGITSTKFTAGKNTIQGRDIHYEVSKCNFCRNFAEDLQVNTEPLIFPIQDEDVAVSIPPTLRNLFKELKSTDEEIVSFLIKNESKFIPVLNYYQKKGRNPCRCKKIGYKINTNFKDISIELWAAIDYTNSMKLFRIIFGGDNVNC